MPDDLLSSIQPPTPASVMQQYSPLGQFGVGLGGMAAGMRGQPDPTMTQANEQFRQQIEMMRLRQSVEKQRMDRVKLISEMADAALSSPDQATRDFGAKTKGEALKDLGLSPSPAVLQGYAKRTHTPAEVQAAARYLDMFGGDVQKASSLSGVPSEVISEIAQGKDSEGYSQVVFGKSRSQRKREELDVQVSEYTLFKNKHPMAPGVEAEASLMAYAMFGKDLSTLPDIDRVNLIRQAQKTLDTKEREKELRKLRDDEHRDRLKAEYKALGSRLERQQVGTLAAKGTSLLNARGELYPGSPFDTVEQASKLGDYLPVKNTQVKEIQSGKYGFKLFGNMRAQVAFLAQNGMLTEAAQVMDRAISDIPQDAWSSLAQDAPGAQERIAGLIRFKASQYTKNPYVLQLIGMESEMIIALRSMGETAVRAMQAFQGAISVLHSGQYDAVDGYIRNLETSSIGRFDPRYEPAFRTSYIIKRKGSKIPERVTLKPGEALDLAKYQVMPEYLMPPQ